MQKTHVYLEISCVCLSLHQIICLTILLHYKGVFTQAQHKIKRHFPRDLVFTNFRCHFSVKSNMVQTHHVQVSLKRGSGS
jgi:hypothetical protein